MVNALPAPSREEVRERLEDLLQHRATREEVADWASTWVIMDEPNVEDVFVWDALMDLCGADLRVSRTEYLHDEENIRDWLACFEVGGDPWKLAVLEAKQME